MSTMNTFCQHPRNPMAKHRMEQTSVRIPIPAKLTAYEKDIDVSTLYKIRYKVK